GQWTYAVFLSFRGEDSRTTITDHLYHAPKDAGINLFRDTEGLQRGEHISSRIFDVIRGSRVSVVVFSKKYSHVELAGSFLEAFCRHEQMFVSEKDKVTEEVEGIALNSPELRTVKVNAEAFVRMNRLRLLRLDNMHFLGHLKVLNLSYSSLLTQNPDYSKLPNLEELILRDCSKLAEVHSSIGCLERLVSLNLKNCKSLIEIPSSICRLKSLKILDISSCPNINWLSEDFGDMVSLTEFLAEGTGITRVPFSATRLTNLMNVSFSVCKEQMTRSISSLIWSLVWPRSASRAKNVQIDCLFQLRSLRTLRLAYCSLSDESIPKEGLGSLQLLENLELSGNWFSSLPDTIRGLLSSRNLYWMIAQISSHFQACPQVLLSCRQLTAYHWKGQQAFNIVPNVSFAECRLRGVTVCVIYSSDKDMLVASPSISYRVTVRNRGRTVELIHQTGKGGDDKEIHYAISGEGTASQAWLVHLPRQVVFRDQMSLEGEVKLEADSLCVERIGIIFGCQVCLYCHFDCSTGREAPLMTQPSSSTIMPLSWSSSCELNLFQVMPSRLKHTRVLGDSETEGHERKLKRQ
ncbi:hypothetical protein CRG98_037663, partial [Punica granatum]